MALQPPSLQYVDFPIFNALIPKEGPKCVPFYFDWTTQGLYDVDLQNQQSRQFISMIQTVWIDNSLNDQPVSINFSIIGQNLKAPPRWQGYFPVMVVNPPRFSVSSVGGSSTQISLMNVPFPAASWSSQQAVGKYDTSGNLLVSDTILESAVSGGHFQSDIFSRGQNDTQVPVFNANVLRAVQTAAAGATSLQVALAGLSAFISSIDISISGSATLAVAGDLTVSLTRAGSALWRSVVSLPATGAGVTGNRILCQMSGLNYLTNAVNEAVDLNLSAALTAGLVTANIGIGYTTVVRP